MKHNYFIPVMIFICISLVLTLSSYYNNKKSMSSYITQLEELNKTIVENEETLKSLDNDVSYYSSQEFIEMIAREKLGLVKDNEIIFIEN